MWQMKLRNSDSVRLCSAITSVLCLSAIVWSTQAITLQHMNHRKGGSKTTPLNVQT